MWVHRDWSTCKSVSCLTTWAQESIKNSSKKLETAAIVIQMTARRQTVPTSNGHKNHEKFLWERNEYEELKEATTRNFHSVQPRGSFEVLSILFAFRRFCSLTERQASRPEPRPAGLCRATIHPDHLRLTRPRQLKCDVFILTVFIPTTKRFTGMFEISGVFNLQNLTGHLWTCFHWLAVTDDMITFLFLYFYFCTNKHGWLWPWATDHMTLSRGLPHSFILLHLHRLLLSFIIMFLSFLFFFTCYLYCFCNFVAFMNILVQYFHVCQRKLV